MTRVAIIGCGPKGLFALERLLDRAEGALEIDVYEPHPVPGAGPVYDPRQPSHLRMNYADRMIDLWPGGHRLVPERERLSFCDWQRVRGAEPSLAGYSGRGEVGRYLADGFSRLVDHAPRDVAVSLKRRRVTRIERDGACWMVEDSSYDEVLLATGHVRTAARIPGDPGRRIAVRGFALTFIDVALSLTEGRGGRFERSDHPFRLVYVPGGSPELTVLPFSRSGRPMLAKPLERPAELTAILAAWESAVGDGDGVDGLLRALSGATGALLGDEGPGAERIAKRLARVASGERWPTNLSVAAEIERSLEIAHGLRRPDASAALGHAWRGLYPAIVDRFSHGASTRSDWPRFRALAREMERIAFGPPAPITARLLALIDAGRVDLSAVCGPPPAADTLIDAVMPAPGAHGPLIAGLIAAGHARTVPGGRGLDVDVDAGCRGADGSVTPGLAAVGRATEDAVIGNDTLSRELHPHLDRWATRILRGLAAA